MSQTSIANYTHEQDQFKALIESDVEPNILMFQGASGSGKSHLINHCLNTVPKDGLLIARLQLQSNDDTIPTLFNVMGSKIGRAELPTFSQRVAGFVGKTAESENTLWRIQLRRHLREIGWNSDHDTRRDWYQQLTDAWFADAEAFDRPLLLAIDTYEQSSSEFDEWFRDEFLYAVAGSTKLRVLIGGQTIPEPMSDWLSCASVHELQGVTDAKEWLVWGELHGIQIPSLEYMAGICKALEGQPSKIIQILKTLPQSAGPSAPTVQSIYQQRKRFRESVSTTFGIDDLKIICLDMEIDYEDFPQIKKAFVRELFAHLGRIGRFEEFTTICQEERPNHAW
jgi:energy-coupling factor transporter ATP-binding protein EcfA2